MTKYNATDRKKVLESSDDAAQAVWGGPWRMPRTALFYALSAATDFIDSGGTTITATDKRTTLSGVTGILVADKNDHSKRLFFPAAGSCNNGSVYNVGSGGEYWSCSLYTSNMQYAYDLSFNNGGVSWQSSHNNRYAGYPVRPVAD